MLKGIDISSNNTDLISLQTAKNQGYDICYIKATEGRSWKSPTLDSQYNEAKACGMLVGFYAFVNNNSIPEEQANFFKSVISNYKQDLKPCIDIEVPINNPTDFTERFINTMGGKDKAIIYTYTSYYRENINTHGYDIWIADYGKNKPTMQDNNIIGWQYSDAGINGHVDVSYWYNVPYSNGNAQAPSQPNVVVNNNTESEMFVEVKKFVNGRSTEQIWTSNEHLVKVGTLDPNETCECLGIHNGHAIVKYTGSHNYDKVGFTNCHVKEINGIIRAID